jgi:hypothetical protein
MAWISMKITKGDLDLPSRLIAKTFVFRLIYGGSAFSYANDPEFTGVSSDPDFWQSVIDEFYTKYRRTRQNGILSLSSKMLGSLRGKYVSPVWQNI